MSSDFQSSTNRVVADRRKRRVADRTCFSVPFGCDLTRLKSFDAREMIDKFDYTRTWNNYEQYNRTLKTKSVASRFQKSTPIIVGGSFKPITILSCVSPWAQYVFIYARTQGDLNFSTLTFFWTASVVFQFFHNAYFRKKN